MNEGVLVSGPIRPLTSDNTYPTALANEIKGGCHNYSTLEDIRVSEERLEENMLVSTPNNILQFNNAHWKNLVTNYIHYQDELLDKWNIPHGLNRYPEVLILNEEGVTVECEIRYIDLNTIEIHSNIPFKGKVQLR